MHMSHSRNGKVFEDEVLPLNQIMRKARLRKNKRRILLSKHLASYLSVSQQNGSRCGSRSPGKCDGERRFTPQTSVVSQSLSPGSLDPPSAFFHSGRCPVPLWLEAPNPASWGACVTLFVQAPPLVPVTVLTAGVPEKPPRTAAGVY